MLWFDITDVISDNVFRHEKKIKNKILVITELYIWREMRWKILCRSEKEEVWGENIVIMFPFKL